MEPSFLVREDFLHRGDKGFQCAGYWEAFAPGLFLCHLLSALKMGRTGGEGLPAGTSFGAAAGGLQ